MARSCGSTPRTDPSRSSVQRIKNSRTSRDREHGAIYILPRQAVTSHGIFWRNRIRLIRYREKILSIFEDLTFCHRVSIESGTVCSLLQRSHCL
ncbi:hypothetical protein AVEN_70524-1 [Araneus ventricosus]|uniref:Uncharacterized protein n=1 Tax=Araneus ventricosus TaxID=182803 RepID=A0A4Y2RZT9_ARAVE|nr:hypothetical protein AVEN_70524-1 [Araneus ventricosus]